MKSLNGSEIADFVKERQAKQVRNLRQTWQVVPRLAVVQMGDNTVSSAYVRLKQRYADDILVEFDHQIATSETIEAAIRELNADDAVHGIIVQLPLEEGIDTDSIVKLVAPEKDVDGLGEAPQFTPATPLAISWLLAAYGVELNGKQIAIVGNGRLVGAPLAALWRDNGYDVAVYDKTSDDMQSKLRQAGVIVSAAGAPGLITSDVVAQGAVVVDAGTASEHGKIVGDIAADVRERRDITMTPEKGGVGPLTVAALFDNVIVAARRVADAKKEA